MKSAYQHEMKKFIEEHPDAEELLKYVVYIVYILFGKCRIISITQPSPRGKVIYNGKKQFSFIAYTGVDLTVIILLKMFLIKLL